MGAENSHNFTFKVLIVLILMIKKSDSAFTPCVENCRCTYGSSEVDCSNLGLSEYPEIPDELPIQKIDFSNNQLTEFPYHFSKFSSLHYIDLSNNEIGHLEQNALASFKSLRTLLMENNSFITWKDLNPNDAFKGASSLEFLSLAGNNISSFSNIDESYLIISHSLTLLDLSYCKITKIMSDFILDGMSNLEKLILKGNSFRSLEALSSHSLKHLTLSQCDLTTIPKNFLNNLDNLIYLDVSENPGLILSENNLESSSLKYLDLSYCNLDSINVAGLSGLRTLLFRGNLMKKLQVKDLQNNPVLETLDFSKNSINYIETTTFLPLVFLKKIDLSFNDLSRLDPLTFKDNDYLMTLNLSRNPFARFSKLISYSLMTLNMSWCEILKIDVNSISDLTNLTILDLSNNFISNLPNGLRSSTLQDLNLNMCRISAITNSTFAYFPELTKLHLFGNRLTTTLKQNYFRNNLYLTDIWLGDNPWMCDCKSDDFIKFYDYLAEGQKVKDKRNLRCASPSDHYGQTWESVCFPVWHPDVGMGKAETIWTVVMGFIIVVALFMCIYSLAKTGIKRYKQVRNERERRANNEEYRELRRRNSQILQTEGRPNAPDSGQNRPPCYEDALKLPKMRRSSKSMTDLRSNKGSNNMRRTRTNADLQDEELVVDHFKTVQSEERLLNRNKERTDDYASAWRNKFRRTQSGSRLYATEESHYSSAKMKSQNLQSAEQIANLQNLRTSPYSQKKWKMHGTDSVSFISVSDDEMGIHRSSVKNSFEIIAGKSDEANCAQSRVSPYTRRRPRGLSVSQLSTASVKESDENSVKSSASQENITETIDFVSNYFRNNNNNKLKTSSSSSSCFEVVGSSVDNLESNLNDEDDLALKNVKESKF